MSLFAEHDYCLLFEGDPLVKYYHNIHKIKPLNPSINETRFDHRIIIKVTCYIRTEFVVGFMLQIIFKAGKFFVVTFRNDAYKPFKD
jgi:hypothetical protein